MKIAVFLLAVFCSVLAAPLDEEEVLEEFTNGNRLFSAGIYKGLLKGNKDNIILSPFSLETVLSLTYEGAKGDTADELVTGLSLPSTKEKVERAYKSVLPKLKGSPDDDLNFSTANKIYIGENVELEDSFQEIAKTVYGSDVGTVNFGANYATANEINEWVESQTNHKIKNLVNPDSIGENTEIILVNAIYLSGQWSKPFVDYPVTKAIFQGSEDDVEVDFLHQVEYLNFYENKELNAKFLELPLKGADISVIVVLPNEADGLSSLEENIEQVLQPQPLKLTGVSVDLPKFSIDTAVEFAPILYNLGVHELFTIDADLSGLSTKNQDLYISSVVQKAFINVTESGVEAAAATDVVGPEAVVDVTDDFKADRPFLYFIKYDDIIVFFGRYVQPEI